MKKALTALTGVAVLAGAATFSVAQPGRGGLDGDGPRGARHGMHERGLDGQRGERAMPQLEGPGADVAMACIEAMGNARQTALEAIRERTQNGIQTIRTLDENEAPNEAIELAGRQAMEAVGAAAITGDTVISRLALECVQTLRENKADQRTIMAVIRVREANQSAVHAGAMRGARGIGFAVRVATGQIDPDTMDGRRHDKDGPHGPHGPRGPHGGGAPDGVETPDL